MPVIKGLDWLDIYQTGWRKKTSIPPMDYKIHLSNMEYGCHYFYQYDIHAYEKKEVAQLVRHWIDMHADTKMGERFPEVGSYYVVY